MDLDAPPPPPAELDGEDDSEHGSLSDPDESDDGLSQEERFVPLSLLSLLPFAEKVLLIH